MLKLKFIARKPISRMGTYHKYGFVLTLHHYCCCPRCENVLTVGPNYQPKYCSECGQRIDFSDVKWQEEKQLGYVERSDTL